MFLEIQKSALLKWYQNECTKQKVKVARYSDFFFKLIKFSVYLFLFYIVLVVIWFGIVNLYKPATNTLDWAFDRDRVLASIKRQQGLMDLQFLLMLNPFLLGFSLMLLTFILYKQKVNKLQFLKDNSIITDLGDKANIVKQDVFNLASKMKIDTSKIKFWKIISKNPFPSIEEDKSGFIHLIIPINFFTFYFQKPQQAKAILAHEFGHVIQKDTNIYLVFDSYFSVIKTLYLPSTCLSIFAKLFSLYKLFNLSSDIGNITGIFVICTIFIIDLPVLIYLNRGFTALRDARKNSEMLADTASILFSENDLIIQVLEDSSSVAAKNDALHPPIAMRIKNIQTLIENFKSS